MKRNSEKLIVLSALCLWLGGYGTATAAVQAVVGFINTTLTSYTVPSGKVLLIEQVSAWAANNNPTIAGRIILQTKILNIVNNGITTSEWGYQVSDKNQEFTLLRPLRIPAGGILGINPVAGYNEIHFMGLLVDAADLYASSVGGSVQETEVAGGALSTRIDLTSPRPVRLATATSPNLTTWAADSTVQKRRLTKPTEWEVQTAVGGSEKFLKVAARAPEATPPVSP